ncbi:MAG TPA: glycosyltransferase family A protein [Phnomibacter sp.]|nr:glycosyltransferase family A protein [Phnomibacter sp.]
MKKGISVIICCYNSAGRLQPTLEHLAKQQFTNPLNWEIVLVNNASTDNTKKIAEKIWQELGAPAPLIIADEDKPGTDHARRHGIFAAGYEYFVFCDDDNWLAENYLALLYAYLEQNPNVGAVGGASVAVSNIELPDWFDQAAGYYAVGAPARKTCDISDYGLWGAGMSGRVLNFRMALPEQIPLVNAGRVGNSTGMGEDGEMCKRIVLQGYRVHFYDQLVLRHFMDAKRVTFEYYQKLVSDSIKPADVIASYARAVYLQNLNGIQKTGFLLFHCLKYTLRHVWNYEAAIKFSKDFLFFGWNIIRLSKKETSEIKRYIQYLDNTNAARKLL